MFSACLQWNLTQPWSPRLYVYGCYYIGIYDPVLSKQTCSQLERRLAGCMAWRCIVSLISFIWATVWLHAGGSCSTTLHLENKLIDWLICLRLQLCRNLGWTESWLLVWGRPGILLSTCCLHTCTPPTPPHYSILRLHGGSVCWCHSLE